MLTLRTDGSGTTSSKPISHTWNHTVQYLPFSSSSPSHQLLFHCLTRPFILIASPRAPHPPAKDTCERIKNASASTATGSKLPSLTLPLPFQTIYKRRSSLPLRRIPFYMFPWHRPHRYGHFLLFFWNFCIRPEKR